MPTHCIEEHKVKQLNELSHTLTEAFNAHFGDDAMLEYYYGKVKTQKLNEDGTAAFKNGGKPWMLTQNSGRPHFNHEDLADDLGLRFLGLHPTLQRCFKAEALYRTTKNDLYADLKEDFLEDFAAIARGQKPELSDAEINTVKETLEKSVKFTIKDAHHDDGLTPINKVA